MLQFQLRNESGVVLYDSILPFRLDFGATGVAEVVQNLVVLLVTPIRSQVLDRELGLDMSFVDRPISILENMLVSELVVKVPQFEDRAEIRDIEFRPSALEAGHVLAAVTCRINL